LAGWLLNRVIMRDTNAGGGLTGIFSSRAILIFVTGLGLAFCPLTRAEQSVTLAWNASASGSVAGYMISYGSDGINFSKQADAGSNTSWTVTGLQEGSTNYFEVSAYDVNYNESLPSSPVEFVAPGAGQASQSASGPVLAAVSGQFANVESILVVTNSITALNGTANSVTFSLGAGAPAGATLSPNGIFQWAPACEQGSTTNLITVWAIDDETPPQSNSISFKVAVGPCVEVILGSSVALIGSEASVPVSLYSTVSLTNVSFSVAAPVGRLTNWTAAAGNAALAGATAEGADPLHPQFNFATQEGRSLLGATPLGTLGVHVLPAGDSAFVTLAVNNISLTALDGTAVAPGFGRPGRVVLIGAQPLLEISQTNFSPVLTLYGNPGVNYNLLSSASVLGQNTWAPFTNITLASAVQVVNPGPSANSAVFFRAVQP